MAKKIPKIKTPKTKMSFIDKLLISIGAGSPVVGRDRLYQSMSGATDTGRAAKAAQRAALIKKYGKWGMRGARGVGLLNPWTAVPVGLMSLAQYGVGSALEPYMNQDVENTGMFFDNRGISAAGNERLLQERLAREKLYAANTAKREGTWLGKLDQRMLGQLRSAGMNEGGIARLL